MGFRMASNLSSTAEYNCPKIKKKRSREIYFEPRILYPAKLSFICSTIFLSIYYVLDILLFKRDIMVSKNRLSPCPVGVDNLIGEVEINNYLNRCIIVNRYKFHHLVLPTLTWR